MKRAAASSQRLGAKANPKVRVVITPVAAAAKGKGGSAVRGAGKGSVAGGGSSTGGASFTSAPDLWAEIAKQAALDNGVNGGKLKGRIKRTKGHIARGRHVFDEAKLVKELGTGACLPVAIGTSLDSSLNVVFCDKEGQLGHEHDGVAHSGLESFALDFNDYNTGRAFRQRFI